MEITDRYEERVIRRMECIVSLRLRMGIADRAHFVVVLHVLARKLVEKRPAVFDLRKGNDLLLNPAEESADRRRPGQKDEQRYSGKKGLSACSVGRYARDP